MASERVEIEPPKPWEILGAFFGYFAVVNDVPQTFRTLGLNKIFPGCFKAWLLKINSNPNFWLVLLFTLITLFIVFWLLPNRTPSAEASEEDRINKAISAMRRGRIFRIVRSLGLVLIREKILDRMGVGLYGTFPRQSTWQPEPSRFASVDRITFQGGAGKEFQYARDFCSVFVRSHPDSSDAYGESVGRSLTFHEIKILIFASDTFLFWWIAHGFKRFFCRCDPQPAP